MIVLGHIGRSFGFLQHWLYSFHFIVFFMLPFLYGQRSFNVRKVGRSLLRVYVPYIWVLILCLLIALVTGYVELQSVQTYLFAFFHGSQALLKETFGFNFPWFMPAFFFLSLFLSILSEKRRWSSFLLILILVYGLGMTIYIALTFPDGLWALSCVSRAAAYFFIGYVAFLFLAKNRSKLHLPYRKRPLARRVPPRRICRSHRMVYHTLGIDKKTLTGTDLPDTPPTNNLHTHATPVRNHILYSAFRASFRSDCRAEHCQKSVQSRTKGGRKSRRKG